MKKEVRDAVSLIFVFEDKIFSIVRQNFLRAFPGYTAFPGGKVDKSDHEYPLAGHPLYAIHSRELVAAMIREAEEELGINIDDLISTKIITDLSYIGRAKTPDFNPYRFNTHFFRIVLNKQIDFKVDTNEAHSFEWSKASEILESYNRGERLIVPPVRFFIEALAESLSFSGQLIFENRFDLTKIVPMIESIKGVKQIMPLSNTVPPADRTNAFLIGNILIDPAPKDEFELSRFMETIKLEKVEKIFLTHHHRDHHNFAPEIAENLSIPLLMSDFTYNHSLKVYGIDYFRKNKIKILKEGDILTQWLGEDVLIIEVPGHDEGQLALMPKSRKWFLAGDLFQGIGTVVVGGEEGNMTKYFLTLEKVIKLAPKVVFPSHGIGLGGTIILEKTLEHRKFREKQILEMYEKGISIEEMLKAIYFNIPEKILKYARANIQSHLEKLKREKRI